MIIWAQTLFPQFPQGVQTLLKNSVVCVSLSGIEQKIEIYMFGFFVTNRRL